MQKSTDFSNAADARKSFWLNVVGLFFMLQALPAVQNFGITMLWGSQYLGVPEFSDSVTSNALSVLNLAYALAFLGAYAYSIGFLDRSDVGIPCGVATCLFSFLSLVCFSLKGYETLIPTSADVASMASVSVTGHISAKTLFVSLAGVRLLFLAPAMLIFLWSGIMLVGKFLEHFQLPPFRQPPKTSENRLAGFQKKS